MCRYARVMTDILLEKVLNLEPFTWGSGNLMKAGEVRKKYIDAFRSADDHDYQLLLEYIQS